MALTLGWQVNEWRETHYWKDPSIDWEGTRDEDRAAYRQTGDGSVLAVKADATDPPTRIRFRALTANERAIILGMCSPDAGEQPPANGAYIEAQAQANSQWGRVLLLAFRCGVDFPDLEVPSGHRLRQNVFGLSLLDSAFTDALVREWGDDIYMLMGSWVMAGSNLSDDQKKTCGSVPTRASSNRSAANDAATT